MIQPSTVFNDGGSNRLQSISSVFQRFAEEAAVQSNLDGASVIFFKSKPQGFYRSDIP